MSIDKLLLFASNVAFCLTLTTNPSHSRQFQISVWRRKSASSGFILTVKSVRIVECIFFCVQNPACRSVVLNKTFSVCHLYSTDISSIRGGTELSYAHLIQRLENDTDSHTGSSSVSNYNVDEQLSVNNGTFKTSPDDNESISTYGSHLFVKKTNSPPSKAWAVCANRSAQLIRIINDATQKMVEKIAMQSGLGFLAIGIHYDVREKRWLHELKKPLTYTAWAPNEPRIGIYAAVTKRSGYKWESLFRHVDGVICQFVG